MDVAAIEALLEEKLMSQEEDAGYHNEREDEGTDQNDSSVRYPVKTDIALLHCRRDSIRADETQDCPSLLGFLEKDVHRVELVPWVAGGTAIRNTLCKARMQIPPTSDWDRLPHHPPLEPVGNERPSLLWIDLRSIDIQQSMTKPSDVLHFLRSLLGTRHTASPWYMNGTTSEECVVLLLSAAPSALTNFRVSDASPSWYLHSVIQCESLPMRPWERLAKGGQDHTRSAPKQCTLLVYRHLTPRIRLSFFHPLTKEPAPPGTLWETLPGPIDDLSRDRPLEDSDIPQPLPLITRSVVQPYLNALNEYPCLQILLDNLPKIQEEATMVKHWTAWPETTHYAKLNISDATPWTVFPLCYCFPATDETKLKWIPHTTSFLPETTRLLRTLVPSIRTALLSRLEPTALLQAHTGWQDLANHVIRVHLPLQMDETSAGLCGLWVDGCVESLQVGKLVAFDDSKVHWAFNYSPDQERIVLILDLVRPKDAPVGTAVGGHSEELDAFIERMGGGVSVI